MINNLKVKKGTNMSLEATRSAFDIVNAALHYDTHRVSFQVRSDHANNDDFSKSYLKVSDKGVERYFFHKDDDVSIYKEIDGQQKVIELVFDITPDLWGFFINAKKHDLCNHNICQVDHTITQFLGANILDKTREKWFEPLLFKMRYMLVVVSVLAIILAAVLIYHGFGEAKNIAQEFSHLGGDALKQKIVLVLDSFLISAMMVIFSLGVYNLFISPISVQKKNDLDTHWLNVKSLDELKGYLSKTILMLLIVTVYDATIPVEFNTVGDILTLALIIAILAFANFISHTKVNININQGENK
jgi:uncharacterized membrane protein YqhA